MGIDLSRVVNSPNLNAQSYTIQRSTCTFGLGGPVATPTNIQGFGVVSVASGNDIDMMPEGDRVTGAMVFHSSSQIYLTQSDGGYNQPDYGEGGFDSNTQWVSDQIFWRGQKFRVMHVEPYVDFGYWKAIAVRMSGH